MANCEQTAGLRSKARAEVRRCCRGHSLLCCGLSIQQGRGGESHFSREKVPSLPGHSSLLQIHRLFLQILLDKRACSGHWFCQEGT